MPRLGRIKIKRDESVITADNVLKVLNETISLHRINADRESFLYNYYKGQQPIENRVKDIRPEICNKVCSNVAYEIVNWKTGYLVGEPILYVSRSERDDISEDLGRLNDIMSCIGKAKIDREIVEWAYICGVGVRIAIQNDRYIKNNVIPAMQGKSVVNIEDETPIESYSLDPRSCYVVYNNGLGEKPIMAVKYVYREYYNDVVQDYPTPVYSVWTPTQYFEVYNNTIIKSEPNILGYIPIVEYPLNDARLGVFEPVLSILDSINSLESNNLDGVEQAVQKLLVLYNADLPKDAAKTLRQAGLLKLKSFGDNKADIKEVGTELNQTQVRTTIDALYQTALNIVGMPNRNSGGTNDVNGVAVYQGNGGSDAEARAKADELSFKGAEKDFLKIILHILRSTEGTSLKLSEIESHFTRRNYEGIQSKSQVLITMLNSDKIHPQLAFESSGLFSDPESAYRMSMEYYESVKKEAKKDAENSERDAKNGVISEDGRDDKQRVENGV